MKFLSITFANHLFALRHFFYLLIALGILLKIVYTSDLPVVFIAIAIIPYLAPAIYVHIQYFIKNKGDAVCLLGNCIEFTNSLEEKTVVDFKNIRAIELHASGGVFKKIDWENFSFQSYHYIVIICDDRRFYITSLMSRVFLEKEFAALTDDVANYTRIKRFIAYIR